MHQILTFQDEIANIVLVDFHIRTVQLDIIKVLFIHQLMH